MKAEIDILDVARNTTITVALKNRRQFLVRFWFGTKLILLAAHIMNMGIKVETISE